MEFMTIFIAVLAAAAAIFAVLFFQDRKDSKKYEAKAESLSEELGDLRCELARKENVGDEDYLTPLTPENIAEFIKKEKRTDVCTPDPNIVSFSYRGAAYDIFCNNFPQEFRISRGYVELKEPIIHWESLEKAAVQTTMDIAMVKASFAKGDWCAFNVITTTRTVAELRRDIEFFIDVLVAADKRFIELYWKIMQEEYPQEYAAREQMAREQREKEQNAPESGADQVTDEMAMRMAQMAAEKNKMQS